VVSTVADFYGNINPATLSGAIDVVVVEQESGELTCSPFHVRFGKLKLLRPVEKKARAVSISINGNPTNLAMKVGEAGEAFFVVEKGGGASLSSDYATSPLTQGLPIPDEIIVDPLNLDEPATPASSPTLLPPSTMPSDLKLAAGLDRSAPSEADDSEPIDPSKFPGPSSPPNWSWTWGSLPVKSDEAAAAAGTAGSLGADDWDKLPSESTGITGAAVAGSTIGEIGQRLDGLAISAPPLDIPEAAPMGSLAAAERPASVLSSALQAQQSLQADPVEQASTAAASADMSVHEKVDTFFASLPAVADSSAAPQIPTLGVTPADTPVGSPSVPGIFERAPENELEAASGLNAAASVPMSTPHPITRLELSLCGVSVLGVLQREETAGSTEYSNAIDEFERQRITATAFEANPRILFDQNLVVRINDSFFNWATASVAVVSSLAFDRGANSPAMAALNVPVGGAGLLFPPSPPNIQRSSSQGEAKRYSGFGFRQWWSRGPSSTPSAPGGEPNVAAQQAEAMGPPDMQAPAIRRQSILSLGIGPKPPNDPQPSANKAVAASPPLTPPISSSFVKSLRLTSDELKALNLKRGMNTVTFSVTSTLQGTATCSAKIYFWDYKTKVVISDVDGTITKSDVLGHVFTMVGRDWTHAGVASLYTNIRGNGYQILYLTSRAIGQSTYTRDYLNKVEQESYKLPDGPVIMSPDRLFTALHREMIQRRPEEFKIACLRDIKKLFGPGVKPFYAGFGNRITDARSYSSVEVPPARIFTIDPTGQVRLELIASYKSTYVKLNDMVDQIFPPFPPGDDPALPADFGDVEFWRRGLPDVEVAIDEEEKLALGEAGRELPAAVGAEGSGARALRRPRGRRQRQQPGRRPRARSAVREAEAESGAAPGGVVLSASYPPRGHVEPGAAEAADEGVFQYDEDDDDYDGDGDGEVVSEASSDGEDSGTGSGSSSGEDDDDGDYDENDEDDDKRISDLAQRVSEVRAVPF
ncbi:hypothetical protein HK405_006624, partial [Cladochytrium tenue]